jgi:hypothetical protein
MVGIWPSRWTAAEAALEVEPLMTTEVPLLITAPRPPMTESSVPRQNV